MHFVVFVLLYPSLPHVLFGEILVKFTVLLLQLSKHIQSILQLCRGVARVSACQYLKDRAAAYNWFTFRQAAFFGVWPEGFTSAAHRFLEGTWCDFLLESTWESRVQLRREITLIRFRVPRPIVWLGICFISQLLTCATILISALKIPLRFLPLRRKWLYNK